MAAIRSSTGSIWATIVWNCGLSAIGGCSLLAAKTSATRFRKLLAVEIWSRRVAPRRTSPTQKSMVCLLAAGGATWTPGPTDARGMAGADGVVGLGAVPPVTLDGKGNGVGIGVPPVIGCVVLTEV